MRAETPVAMVAARVPPTAPLQGAADDRRARKEPRPMQAPAPHPIGRLLAGIALSVAVLAQAPVAPVAAAAPACTTAQGQAFIDAGRYDKAIQAFSCVIAAQPTEVEGYRGRIEALVLLGRYSDAVLDEQRVTAFV